jgi:hypothetical protein
MRITLSAILALGTAGIAGADPTYLDSTEALIAALRDSAGARHLHLRRGTYVVDRTLVLPDGTTLRGDGVMRYDETGLPQGFEPGSETVIRAADGFAGDVVAMGHDTHLQHLVVQGVDDNDSEHGGNIVAVVSRRPNDRIEGTIVECEIVNPNPQSYTDRGPKGYGIVVVTRNVAGTSHVGAGVRLRLQRSIVRAPNDGGALFAINFAPKGNIEVTLRHNRMEAPLAGTAAASRPAAVDGARVRIDSAQSLYTGTGSAGSRAWAFFGASSSPHVASDAPNGPSGNTVSVRSVGDRIANVSVGLMAVAGRRIADKTGPVSDNTADLDLRDLEIRTVGADGADLVLHGTLLSSTPAEGVVPPTVGERNTLRVRMRGVSGSGRRANVYSAAEGRIVVAGDRASFVRDNPEIDPTPPPEFFDAAP